MIHLGRPLAYPKNVSCILLQSLCLGFAVFTMMSSIFQMCLPPTYNSRDSPKGARAKGAWGNLDIGHTKFIPTTYQRHGVTITVIDSNVYSASISRKKSALPKCASCMNHIWAIALFGQARFTPARFADYQNRLVADVWWKDFWDFRCVPRRCSNCNFSWQMKDKRAKTCPRLGPEVPDILLSFL